MIAVPVCADASDSAFYKENRKIFDSKALAVMKLPEWVEESTHRWVGEITSASTDEVTALQAHIYEDLRFGNPGGNEAAGVSRGVKSEKSDLTAPQK